MRGIIEDLKERIRASEEDARDHKNDAPTIRRELAGYIRGLRDALFVVESKQRRGRTAAEAGHRAW